MRDSTADRFHGLPALEHAGLLADLLEAPPSVRVNGSADGGASSYTCTFCGVGDHGTVQARQDESSADSLPPEGVLHARVHGQPAALRYRTAEGGILEVETSAPLTAPGGILAAEVRNGSARAVTAVDAGLLRSESGVVRTQRFRLYAGAGRESALVITGKRPTPGCVKFNLSTGFHRPVFPYQLGPSVLDSRGRRVAITYEAAVARFADLLLDHRPPEGRTLIYCCGQIDYFSIFSFQEAFRILGVRSMTGNAEHCLNAGAVHNQVLTGQEGPFLTIDLGLEGPNRFYLLNGWNGLITHPPVFQRIMKREDLDAYLVEVNVTESAKMLASRLGPERVLLVKPGTDPHLALAVGHELLAAHPEAVEQRFVRLFSDPARWEAYRALAAAPDYAPDRVAARIAAAPAYEKSVLDGIRGIAARLARAGTVPINIPSMGLSQSKGIVAHCLWGNALAMVGKYGLYPDGTAAGGTLRVPGQINAQSEVQGLSRKYFMGRIPIDDAGCVDACRRVGLPDDALRMQLLDQPRAALDYSDPSPGWKELIVCFGTQFESNMPGRKRWLKKLADPSVTLVVIDPIADPYSLERADLVLPPPPHSAVTKLMQNGEWRMFLSVPRKAAPPETRSDPTIVYDTMAEISRRLREDEPLRTRHPDLAVHAESGYLRERFEAPEAGGGLPRLGGEVSRPALWARVQEYMAGGEGRVGPLYCRPVHDDGRPIEWRELLEKGSVVYGGVGTNRFVLDYDKPGHQPFGDIYCRPGKFTFFVPTADDLQIPEGPILVTGRSCLSDDKVRMRFAVSSFNSGKATTPVDMPDENPLFVSEEMAATLGVRDGDRVRVANRVNGEWIVLPVVVSSRVKGTTLYTSFHKCKAEIEKGRYVNDVTEHLARCPYTGQTKLKNTLVTVEAVARTVGEGA